MSSQSFWSTFEALAKSVGQVEAILAPARDAMRFADLPARLVAVRDALAQCGIGRGDRVASALPRGPETAVCYLGVASCAIYAPLNPDYTEAEFRAYLAKLRPKALIVPEGSEGAARSSANALAIPVIELAAEPAKPAGSFSLLSPAAARASVTPQWNSAEDLALILLTSGTSSKPKLVPLRQRHLLAYAHASERHYGLGVKDRCLHVMPMFHGHGLMSTLIVPLACGSGVICASEFDIRSFFEQMRLLRPTWYSAASSIHHAILDRIGEYRDIAGHANLRFIRSGSGRLDPKVMAGLESAFGAPMIERYGMSEAGSLTGNPLPPGLRKQGTVGKVMFNEVAIIDERGNIVGPGREGEVVARGPSVFDGYLDDPEANAAAFINGWFRTGDLGRFDEEGYLTLIGRIKDVINRGGEKIGTIEVEAALTRHPAVEQACVFPIPHPSLGEEVAAAVVLSSNEAVTEREIQAHARGMLAGFKVPRRVFFLPSFPKSPTNKIRRDQVALMCRGLLAESRAAEEIALPRSTLDREIAKLWSGILRIDAQQIDTADDFFLIGGDSLKAYELFARIRKRYRVTVGLRHLFDEASTVAGMARLVEAELNGISAGGSNATGLVSIKEDGERPPLFAVPGSGGNPVGFIHLARLLDRRQPLIGIESRGMDGTTAPLARVEQIAADNLARIRKIQPVGPYFLSGACYGGRVAYEMARQLEAAGERVGLLVMLDPSSPFFSEDGRRRGDNGLRPPRARRASVARFVFDRVRLIARSFAQLNGAERRALISEKMRVLLQTIRQRDLFRGDRSELYARAVYQANRAAGRRYVPGPFGGPVVLCFTADRPVRGERNYRLDWMKLIPQCGAPVYVSGKDSGDMLNLPHVYELADCVNRWLEQAHGADRRLMPSEPLAAPRVDSEPAWT
jgi:acyl-CoA synthetase (AMP-forming)/AMP-acid ligase II/thioesterase domain-containing protein/acyl carrier protein